MIQNTWVFLLGWLWKSPRGEAIQRLFGWAEGGSCYCCLTSAGPAAWHPAQNQEEEQQRATYQEHYELQRWHLSQGWKSPGLWNLFLRIFWGVDNTQRRFIWALLVSSHAGLLHLCIYPSSPPSILCLSSHSPSIPLTLCESSSPFPLKMPGDGGGTSKLLRGKVSAFAFASGVGTFTFPYSEPAQCLSTSAQRLHGMQPGFCWPFCERRAEGASLHLKGDLCELWDSVPHSVCSISPIYVWLRQLLGGLSFLHCSWTGKEQKEQLFELEPPKLVSDVELQSRRSRILRGSGHECYCGAQGRKQEGTLCSVQVSVQSWVITPWSFSHGGAWLPWLLPWRCKKVTVQSKRQVRKKWAKAERNSKIYHIGNVSVSFFFPPELGGNEEADQNVPFKNRSQTPRRFQGNSWCYLVAKASGAFPL